MRDAPVEALQDRKELQRLLDEAAKLAPRRVLEIGSMYGGTLWHWIQLVAENGTEEDPPLVVSIDLPVSPADPRHNHVMESRALWQGWAYEAGVDLVVIEADSKSPEAVGQAGDLGPFDVVFIDGGHDFDTVDSDFKNYYPMVRVGGFAAIHDVSVPEENPHKIETGVWWHQLVHDGKCETCEIMGYPDAWGVGLVWNKPKAKSEPEEKASAKSTKQKAKR